MTIKWNPKYSSLSEKKFYEIKARFENNKLWENRSTILKTIKALIENPYIGSGEKLKLSRSYKYFTEMLPVSELLFKMEIKHLKLLTEEASSLRSLSLNI